MIDTIVKTYNIDPDRIYVAGCSDGGWMTVNMAIANPDLFAAIVLICGAYGSSTDEELLTLKDNNIWLVHAMNDTSVDPTETSDRLHALIPSSIYTVGASIKIGPGKMGKDILNKTGKRGNLDIVTGCPG